MGSSPGAPHVSHSNQPPAVRGPWRCHGSGTVQEKHLSFWEHLSFHDFSLHKPQAFEAHHKSRGLHAFLRQMTVRTDEWEAAAAERLATDGPLPQAQQDRLEEATAGMLSGFSECMAQRSV